MTDPAWTDSEHHVADGVYTIRLARPEKRNALSPNLYHEIKLGIMRGRGLAEVDVIVIEGSGGAFASGGDLAVFLDILDRPAEEFLPAFVQAFEEPLPFRTMLESPKPIVAKIDGICMAGGLVMAAAADVAVASSESLFGVPEGRVGLADPFCATLLPLAIGTGRARYLMMTAARIDAATAERWGLVARVVAPAELDGAVDEVIELLRSTAPESRAAYKRTVNDAIPHMSVEAVLEAALSANGREGLAAFVEGRRPDWRQERVA